MPLKSPYSLLILAVLSRIELSSREQNVYSACSPEPGEQKEKNDESATVSRKSMDGPLGGPLGDPLCGVFMASFSYIGVQCSVFCRPFATIRYPCAWQPDGWHRALRIAGTKMMRYLWYSSICIVRLFWPLDAFQRKSRLWSSESEPQSRRTLPEPRIWQ